MLTGLRELVLAEVKALLFGVVAGLVGCYRGLTVKGGPKGVGIAVNETVVYAFICLFVINVIMTAIGVRVLAEVSAPMSYDATLTFRRLLLARCPRPSTASASRRCSTANRSATSPTR